MGPAAPVPPPPRPAPPLMLEERVREKRTQRRPRVILLRALLSWLLPPGLLPLLLLLLLMLLLLMEDVDTERWGNADVVVVLPALSDKLSTRLPSRPDSWGRLVVTDTMASTAVVGGVF